MKRVTSRDRDAHARHALRREHLLCTRMALFLKKNEAQLVALISSEEQRAALTDRTSILYPLAAQSFWDRLEKTRASLISLSNMEVAHEASLLGLGNSLEDPAEALLAPCEPTKRRYVVGPDGAPITAADLPTPNTTRWVVGKKALLISAVRGGLISIDDAAQRYTLSLSELLVWNELFAEHGLSGLRVTREQDYVG